MHSFKEGGQPSHWEFSFTFDVGSRFWIVPLRVAWKDMFCSDVITFTIDTAVTDEAGSPCLGTLPSPSPPLAALCLLGWLARNWGIVCRCAWREASPSALGEHVVWECLRWHSFKLSPTQHAGVGLYWMTMLNPPPTKGAFSGWGDTGHCVDKQERPQCKW